MLSEPRNAVYPAYLRSTEEKMNEALADYLGKPASTMLADSPFKCWPFEKMIEDDLEEQICSYVSLQHGLEVRCDQHEQISAIFIYAATFNDIDGNLLGFSLSLIRKDITKLLGAPTNTNGGIDDPALSRYGAWDRFARAGYSIHVEYKTDADQVKMVTLMRADTVPPRRGLAAT